MAVEQLLAVADEAERRAKQRRVGSDGRASRESCVAAIRAVFTRAVNAGHASTNPAMLVEKPRRLPNRRRALSNAELDDVWAAVTATTNDPELELLLLRFHLESGARRIGAINLRVRDIDATRHTVWLREKFGVEREQRITDPDRRALCSRRSPRCRQAGRQGTPHSSRTVTDQRSNLRPDLHPGPGPRAVVPADPAHRARAPAHGHHGG